MVEAIGLALDYSAGVIPGAAVKAAKYDAVIRYLPKPSPSGVATITQAEYEDLTSQGRRVVVVFEHNDRLRPLQGHTAGVQDAQWALQVAQQEGIPVPPRKIYMAYDIWEVQYRSGTGLDASRAYAAGAHSVLGEAAAAYGYLEILNATKADGTAFAWWQCGRESDVVAHANLYQQNYGQVTVAGVLCDVNKILTSDYGQHPAPNDGPTPAPNSDDQEMENMKLFGIARLDADWEGHHKGDIFAIRYLAGNYSKVPNPDTLGEVVGMLKRNYKADQWNPQFDTPDMSRFGTEIPWGPLA